MTRKLFSRWMRQGQVGQSIIILALGFIGLLVVVGITTDVSLLFARYAQLRRAVDAASVAAAGQMRQDRSLATVSLTARQFIEFHGISPRNVFVESCENAPIEDADPTTPGLQGPGGTELFELDPEICTQDQRKLVRVTAQIDSPTIFLRLIGFGNIELQASAISETAVLDVVLIMDVSESMLNETTYSDWATVDQGIAYIPPFVDRAGTGFWPASDQDDTVFRRMGYDADASNGVDPLINGAADVNGFIPILFDASASEFYSYPVSGDVVDPNTNITTTVDPLAPPDVAAFANPTAIINPYAWWEDWFWQEHLLGTPQALVNDRLWYRNAPNDPNNTGAIISEGDAKANANLVNPSDRTTWNTSNWFYEVTSFVPARDENNELTGINPAEQRHPREECRVRFYPYSTSLNLNDYIQSIYTNNGHAASIPNDDKWRGFVPTYDYFGCCNDPGNGTVDMEGNITPGGSVEADGNFSDLICQPFKQAKDATRLFLERIDFVRGDRVAFVTFDRTAYIIDPDGAQGNPAVIAAGGANYSPMIEFLNGQYSAVQTLNQHIGVRAEPNFYRWNPQGGGWHWDAGTGLQTQFAQGFDFETETSRPINYNDTTPAALNANNYPVAGNCNVQNASLYYPFSRYATRTFGTLPPTLSPYILANFNGAPSLRNVMTPDIFRDPFWNGLRTSGGANTGPANSWTEASVSYDITAGCRGTNMGAALREANNALTDEDWTRREGAVWIMILLSDGAAGASDPTRTRARDHDYPDPYIPYRDVNPADGPILDPDPYQFQWWQRSFNATRARIYGDPNRGARSYYGYYGVCPPGANTAAGAVLGELVLLGSPAGEPKFPSCSDEAVTTRHFCTPTVAYEVSRLGSVGIKGPAGNELNTRAEPNGFPEAGFGPGSYDEDFPGDPREINQYDLDIGEYGTETNCDVLYDVDDYARDWADFVSGIGQASFGVRTDAVGGDAVLPTIFTIGFGLTFDTGTGTCADNVEDCLGEELLRYIADVGDNFNLDTDYQQDWHDDGLLNNSLTAEEYGPEDPCEPDGGGYDGTNITLRNPGESCGNYFNAPDRAELELVFNEIASRMFTRIAG